MSSRDIYLVESVPLATSGDVFKAASAQFRGLIKQIPDGKVAEPSDFAAASA
jgi:hypothetical protein